MLEHEYTTKEIFINNFWEDFRKVSWWCTHRLSLLFLTVHPTVSFSGLYTACCFEGDPSSIVLQTPGPFQLPYFLSSVFFFSLHGRIIAIHLDCPTGNDRPGTSGSYQIWKMWLPRNLWVLQTPIRGAESIEQGGETGQNWFCSCALSCVFVVSVLGGFAFIHLGVLRGWGGERRETRRSIFALKWYLFALCMVYQGGVKWYVYGEALSSKWAQSLQMLFVSNCVCIFLYAYRN